MNCIEYSELKKTFTKASIDNMLASFKVSRNQDLDKFLHEEASKYEKANNTRNYFIFNDDSEVIGYFTLSIHSLIIDELLPELDSRTLKKIRGYGKKEARSVGCYLIGQLARNDNTEKKELSGKEILNQIKILLKIGQNMFGGRFAAIDCIDELVPFYNKNGFVKVNKKGDLNTMIMFL